MAKYGPTGDAITRKVTSSAARTPRNASLEPGMAVSRAWMHPPVTLSATARVSPRPRRSSRTLSSREASPTQARSIPSSCSKSFRAASWSAGFVLRATSSTAASGWNYTYQFDANAEELATSRYEIRDRFLGTLNWRHNFFGDYKTEVGLVYEGRTGRPFSYVYFNDANGDNRSANDLFYVPSGPGDVLFGTLSSGGVFTADPAMEQRFFDWLAKNPQLGRYAGSYAPQNSGRASWVNTFDIRISQELPGFFKGHKSEIWLDVMNVGNLINKDWGRIQYNSGYSDRGAVFFQGVDPATGKYVYNFNADPVSSSNPNGVTSEAWTDWESRWSLQLGFRYKF